MVSARSCVRYLLFVFNLKFFLFGIAVLLLGALNLTAHMENSTVSIFLHVVPITLIVIGSLVLIVALFGCLGALFTNRCLLYTFAALIISIFVVEVLGGITLYSMYNEEALTEDLKESLKYYNSDKDIKKFWNLINTDLHCCGVLSNEDWGDSIPNSCCKDLDINDVCHKEQTYETPCMEVMVQYFKKNAPVVFIIIAVLQIFSVTFALCLGLCKQEQFV